jgi:hypothetical protein
MPPDDALAARVAEVRKGLDAARFAGRSPVLDVPADAAPLEIAAHVLAAERANAGLALGGVRYGLHDAGALGGYRAALNAVRAWGLADAERRLDLAASRATDPLLQQRIGLWQLLVALLQLVVRTEPDAGLRSEQARFARDFLAGADRLADAEREHYRTEIDRVVAAHAEAHADPASPAGLLWCVLRARRALAAEEPHAALLWLLRLARLAGDRLPADDAYLAGLLAGARATLRLVLGDVPEEEQEAARAASKGLQAWDLYRALTARLGDALGLDVARATERFTIRPYRSEDE